MKAFGDLILAIHHMVPTPVLLVLVAAAVVSLFAGAVGGDREEEDARGTFPAQTEEVA